MLIFLLVLIILIMNLSMDIFSLLISSFKIQLSQIPVKETTLILFIGIFQNNLFIK